MVLTREHLSEFDRLGFVRLPGAFTEADAARIHERVWEALGGQYGMRRDAPDTWTVEQPRRLQSLTRAGVFDALGSPRLVEAVDGLLGRGAWPDPVHWGTPLISFPRKGAPWDVPHSQWHIDWPARGANHPCFGVKVLACFGPVLPRGGGTVVLAGSHRLVASRAERASTPRSGRSSAVREALMRQHPWLRGLGSREATRERIARFMEAGTTIEGVDLRVVELTGAPGDAILFHPWLFHAPAPNCLTTPRMVVGHNIHTASGVARFAPGRRLPEPPDLATSSNRCLGSDEGEIVDACSRGDQAVSRIVRGGFG